MTQKVLDSVECLDLCRIVKHLHTCRKKCQKCFVLDLSYHLCGVSPSSSTAAAGFSVYFFMQLNIDKYLEQKKFD